MLNTECETDRLTDAGETGRKTTRAHGGNIYQASRQFGVDARKIVDFSSNVNPLGPSSFAKRAAKRALSVIGCYPDPEMIDLRRALGRYFGIKSEQVMCGNGSIGLIHLIPRVFRPKSVLVLAPTFPEYAFAAADAGSSVVTLSLKEGDGFRVDPVEMAFALKDVDMAFLCNPNNPTGQLIPRAEMLEIARYALQQGVRLVVDEAFMDFIGSESIVKEAVQTSNVICLRTFTKFFGMPGLRIGYAVSDEATVAALRDGQEPWTLSIPAEQAAMAALNDWGHSKKTLRLIEKERDRLIAAIRLMPGVEIIAGGVANFILLKFLSADTYALRQKLGSRGMLVRDCSSFPGLDDRYIRISIRTRCDNHRLIKALRELLLK